jgi:ribonuclease HII
MTWIVGIDEVGRGALAGPVVVAAAAIPQGGPPKSLALGPLKDSKKLSAKQREKWTAYCMAKPNIHFAIARIYPREIEKRNISKAANLAAQRAFKRLSEMKTLARTTRIYLDGGLFLGNGRQPKTAKTVIKADERFAAVKIASIVAKVHRDRFMIRLAKKHPGYGFEIHKGYGTKAHQEALRKYGPSEAHRLTFLGKSNIMDLTRSHGRRTSKTSFKGKSRPQAVSFGDEKATTFHLQKLRRAEARTPRLPTMRQEVVHKR